MTREDRNLLRAMFLVLFSMLWNMSSVMLGVKVSADRWSDLMNDAKKLAKKEE